MAKYHNVSLNQNYPNPFNIETTISFNTNISGLILLEIYDFKGRKVRNLLQNNLDSGEHSIIWKGKNSHGYILPTGIYFYRLSYLQDNKIRYLTKKMVLIK